MAEVIILEGKLDMRALNGLHDSLGQHLADDVTLDMGQVTHLGALCLQSMLAAAKAVRASGGEFACVAVSDVLEAQFRTMGVASTLLSEGEI